jgi:hypothetical protein
VLVWDNVRLHLTAGMKEFIEANAEWLTVFQLPTYAPDLNPQEGIWSLVERDIGNLAAADLSEITQAHPVPPGIDRRLSRGHWADHRRLTDITLSISVARRSTPVRGKSVAPRCG